MSFSSSQVCRPGSRSAQGRCPHVLPPASFHILPPVFSMASLYCQTPWSPHNLCLPQITSRHRFRLFQVIKDVIRAQDVLEETWQKYFLQLALEHMTKSTVGLPPIAHRLGPRGLLDSVSCLGIQTMWVQSF